MTAHADLDGAVERAPGRGRELRRRALHPGARARRRPGRGRARAAPRRPRPAGACSPRRTACRCTTRAGRPLALDARRARAAVRGRTATGARVTRRGPAPGRPPASGCSSTTYVDLLAGRAGLRARWARRSSSAVNAAARARSTGASPSLREPRPGDALRQLPRRGRGRADDARARHRRRGLHRLEPRARAARARRRGARARQLLDRQPRQPRRRSTSRSSRASCAATSACTTPCAGRRGRLPPRRARLGAALGAGSAHLERGQRRGDAERPARRARRGRAPRRLLVELVGLRHARATCP